MNHSPISALPHPQDILLLAKCYNNKKRRQAWLPLASWVQVKLNSIVISFSPEPSLNCGTSKEAHLASSHSGTLPFLGKKIYHLMIKDTSTVFIGSRAEYVRHIQSVLSQAYWHSGLPAPRLAEAVLSEQVPKAPLFTHSLQGSFPW